MMFLLYVHVGRHAAVLRLHKANLSAPMDWVIIIDWLLSVAYSSCLYFIDRITIVEYLFSSWLFTVIF